MSASVDKQDTLLLSFLQLLQSLIERAAENRAIALLQLLAHIHHFHRWQRSGLDSFGEGEVKGWGNWGR
jgi:hypothetical protein